MNMPSHTIPRHTTTCHTAPEPHTLNSRASHQHTSQILNAARSETKLTLSAVLALFCLLSLALFTLPAKAFGTNSSSFESSNLETNSAFSGAQAEPEFLKVDQAFVFSEEIVEGGVKLHWQVTPGYYLYLERFKFKSLTESGVSLGEAQFSTQGKLEVDPYFGEVHIIDEDLSVFLPVTLEGIADTELKITYQGCAKAGLCYPPTHKRVMFLPVSSEPATQNAQAETIATNTSTTSNAINTNSASSAPSIGEMDNASSVFDFIKQASLPAIFGIFFLLGLGLTFTPCVFPMVPIISSIIAGQANPTTAKSFALALAYVLGMAITYALAGVATGMLGAGANVQAALQNPYLLSVFAVIFVILALAMFGLFELQLPAFIRDRLNSKSQNLSGGHLGSVFFIGALSALVVSPCVSAPLAGALLYISATGDALIGGTSLFALGLGMGVPLILVAIGGGKFFPKAGAWMNSVKAVFGVMLIAVAIWLISRFAPAEVSMLLWAVLLGLSATQMGAFDAAQAGWPRIFKGLGLILAFCAALLLIGAASGASNPLKPLQGLQSQVYTTSSDSQSTIKLPFDIIHSIEELETQLEQENSRPTLVDFYADWCISCIVMEQNVFPQPQIKSKMEQFQLLKADVTANTEQHQKLMEQFDLFGPPSILFFDKDGNELKHLRIVGEISAKGFEERLAKALGSS